MTNTNFSERRTDARYDVKVEVHLTRLTDLSIHKSLTRDLSRGGLCLNLKNPFDRNEYVKIKMSLLLSPDAQSEPLEVKAKIAWCSEDEDGSYQIGMAFDSVEEEIQSHINTFIDLIDEELPLV